MAVAGGYLDQPRRWRRLILLMDDRASKIERAYKQLQGDPLNDVNFDSAPDFMGR